MIEAKKNIQRGSVKDLLWWESGQNHRNRQGNVQTRNFEPTRERERKKKRERDSETLNIY